MRAAVRDRYGPPDVVRVVETPAPEPVADQVLVRVAAASLNTADLDHLRGRPRAARLATGWRRPRSPRLGLDVAGTVEAVGPLVRSLQPGDRVWADLFAAGHGAFAELAVAPERVFATMPSRATFAEAATVPHSGVLALQALTAGRLAPAQRVLVNGAGGCVGPFAVQIAKAHGAHVTAVDHGGAFGLLASVGADRLVDHTRTDITRGRDRFDLIVDIAATRSPLRFRRLLAPGGRYVLIARTLGGFFHAAVLGALTAPTSRRLGVFGWEPSRRQDLDRLADLLDAGLVKPVVDREIPLGQVEEGLRHLGSGSARGKVVVLPGA